MHALNRTGSNLIGIHAGVWVPDWSPAAARYAIGESAAAGFDLIEIPVADPSTTDLALTVRLLEQHSLRSVVSLALSPSEDINTDDAETSTRGESKLLDAVRFARDTGSPYIGGVIFGAMTKYAHTASSAARDNSLDVLRRVAAAAHTSGITLGVEYVNRYESNLLNTAAQAVQFVRDLDQPNVLVHLDTFHANVEETSQSAAVTDCDGMLGYIHAAENHRGYLGTGSIDWSGLFKALVRSGYTGPITFESFSRAVVSPDTADEIGLWRSLWDDPAPLARHAHEFLRRHLDEAHTHHTES